MKRLLNNRVKQWFVNLIRNSKYRWLVIFGSILYLISPLDISPDVFPVIGWIDDGLLASIVITELAQLFLDQRRKQTDVTQKYTADGSAESVIDVEATPVG